MSRKIKVLHVSTSFGTPSAGYRLHKALLQETDIDSYCFVQRSLLNDIRIIKFPNTILTKIMQKIFYKAEDFFLNKYYPNCSKFPFSSSQFSSKKVVKQINKLKPDIVHFHWICDGLLSIEDIAKIKAPIVWTLHDQWGYTGGCHCVAEQEHTGESKPVCCDVDKMCSKYTKNCGSCGVLRSKKQKDLSFSVLRRKKLIFAKIPQMVIVGVSKWMADCAQRSAVFSSKKVVCLPNPLNTNIFKPMDKTQARTLWNLPQDKKLILFGATAISLPYKGYDLLVEALSKIMCKNVDFVVFGSGGSEKLLELQFKTHYVGFLSDEISLVSLYSACDVMLHPSQRESFGQTASESLACGTPVVAFGIGGLPDIIDHQKNGYLAQAFDTADLANGIDWVLGNDNYGELCKNAREKVVQNFDYGVVAPKYVKLYEGMLE